jgi:hypothetical protein
MTEPDSPDELILEGIVVTLDATGTPNIAPMGPRVDRLITRLALRPFKTARTFANLVATRRGVFHVTDDVELLAAAAIGQLEPQPPLATIDDFACPRLADTCRWFAFQVESIDDGAQRSTMYCRVVRHGEVRPFFGFNRAKHAVLEAAILATRVGILPASEIEAEMRRLRPLIEKTAGQAERRAFERLATFIESTI